MMCPHRSAFWSQRAQAFQRGKRSLRWAWPAIGSVSATPIPFVWAVSHDLLPIIIGVHPSESPVGVPEFRVRPCCQAEFWLKLLSQLRTLAHAHSQLLGPVNTASGDRLIKPRGLE